MTRNLSLRPKGDMSDSGGLSIHRFSRLWVLLGCLSTQLIVNRRDLLSQPPVLDGCITFIAQLPHTSRASVSSNLLPTSWNASRCYCVCLTHIYRANNRLHINYNVSRNLPRTFNSSVSFSCRVPPVVTCRATCCVHLVALYRASHPFVLQLKLRNL